MDRHRSACVELADFLSHKQNPLLTVSTISKPVLKSELIIYILSGLGSEYESVVTTLTNRPDAANFSIVDIMGALLNHESWLEDLALASDTRSANLAGVPPKKNNFQKPPQRFSPNFNNNRGVNTSHNQYENNFDPNWYPDSGATHHMTPNIDNLQSRTEYTGPNQVNVGNGQDICHVPSICKNLFSVSRFTKNNDLFFEFHRGCCYVKDYTGRILLQGASRNGLYSFPTSATITPEALLKEHTSLRG
ncbi:PREDICTED: uncharacterized protein LOC104609616 [Nelumbo nucifera]|uniref:Uncharacterized protein LOC104609616 n=1 Tax=Nelumbo nucifera TaxID=4432 RepID=A0A1U8BCH4_NELNU|nr:PREDICTED: uncharacterized protein LOC104609616 [Nelumbo nucifera]